MSVLILLQIIDIDFIQQLIYTPDQLITKETFCLTLISKFIEASLKDPIYRNGLKFSINDCVFQNYGNNQTTFINMNLSNSNDYYIIERQRRDDEDSSNKK